MPFDNERWSLPANHGDAASPSLHLAIAISQITDALRKIEVQTGIDLSAELTKLDDINEASFKDFKNLTGWTSDGD